MNRFSAINNLFPNRRISAAWMAAILMASSSPLHANGGGVGNSDSCGSCHGANTGTAGTVTATGAIGNSLTLRQGQPLILQLGPSGGRGFSAAITADGVRVGLAGTNLTGGNAQIFSTYYFTHTNPTSGGPYTFTYSTAGIPIGTYVIDSVMRNAGSGWQNGAKITLKIEKAVDAPDAPTIGAATAVNGQISVVFTPPAGGAAPTGYTATCGSATGTSTASPVIVQNPLYDASVQCSVTASNAAGSSASSGLSNIVTPNKNPGAPTITSVTPGNNQVTMIVSAPSYTGGVAIRNYTATCGSQIGNSIGAAPTVNVGTLNNGTPYSCSVTATNVENRTSAPSAAVSATPFGPPDAPVISSITAGDGQLSVLFAAPASNGSPISIYTATCYDSTIANPPPHVGTNAASPVPVTGLVNGKLHYCRLAATNAAGPSPDSSNSFFTPNAPQIALPGAPTGVTASAGDRSATVSFNAASGTGITSYTASCGSRRSDPALPAAPMRLTVTGLDNDTSVDCSVFATNSAGNNGPASSPPVSVTPRAPVAAARAPDAPIIGTATAGEGRVSVTFTAVPTGNDGGAAVIDYLMSCNTAAGVSAGPAVSGPAPSLTMTGLSSTTAYRCRVSARNSVGVGQPSADSNSVTPLAAPAPAIRPGAPTIGTATGEIGAVRVTFTAPSDNGGPGVIDYLLACYTAAGAPAGTPVTGPASPIVMSGLSSTTAYHCRVSARNSVGVGQVSADSNNVTPLASTPAGKPDIVFSSPPPTVNPPTVLSGGQVRLGPVTIFTLKNLGTAPTGPFRFGVYLSRDATITTADTFLNFASNDFNIAAGAEAGFGNVTVTIPPDTAPGNYFIGMLADDTNRVDESNENNNFVSSPITISAPAAGAKPDIMFTNPLIAVSPNLVSPGGQVRLDLNGSLMKNQGTVATGPFRFGVYMARRPVITAGDISLNFFSNDFNIPAGGTAGFGGVIVTIPMGTPAGNYYIGILADDNNRVSESNENNNYAVAQIVIR